MMDCEEARELIDAHALGLLERGQARPLENHLSRCAGCRTLSQEAAEVAAYLALAAPLRRAGPALRLRLVSRLPTGISGPKTPFPSVWAAAAAVLLAVSLGALAWAAVLQNRVGDLESDNSRLARLVDDGKQVQVSLVATQEALLSQQQHMESALQEQEVVLAVALDDEARPHNMLGIGPAAGARARYVWSAEYHLGILYAAEL